MPVKRRKSQALICVFSILLILGIDQWSKALIQLNLLVGDSIPIIRNVLHITFVTNTGAAFGFFKDSTWVFIAISLVAILAISILIFRAIKRQEFLSNPLFNFGLILIISGAIGNLVDRLRFTYVIDFIDFRIWPVFNVADSSITIGTLLLILSQISLHFSNVSSRGGVTPPLQN